MAVGRPPCLWTCLSSLVKPVDLGDIKTAIYEKARNKTHKHPATETIKCHLISQRALLQDERHQQTAVYPCCTGVVVVVVVRTRCKRLHPGTFFFLLLLLLLSLCEGVLFACLGCERRTLAESKFLPEKRRSKTNRAVCIQVELNRRTTVWPAVRNILSQPCLPLKQTPSRHVHLGQKGEESEKKKRFRFELH